MTLAELYGAGPFILPIGELDSVPVDSYWDRAIIERLKPIDEAGRPAMHQPVKALLKFQRGDVT